MALGWQSRDRCEVKAPNPRRDPAAGGIKWRAGSRPLIPILSSSLRAGGHPSPSASKELGGWRMSLGDGC